MAPIPTPSARWPWTWPVQLPVDLARMAVLRARGPAAMEAWQLARVRAMVSHAATTVPLYRDLYAGRVGRVDDIAVDSRADLAALPTVDKAAFLGVPETDRVSAVVTGPLHPVSTSGTTGQPFAVQWTPQARWLQWVQSLLMMRTMGVGPRTTQVAIVAGRSLGPPFRPSAWHRLTGARVKLAHLEPPTELADRIAAVQPGWLSAFPHELVDIGEALTGRARPRLVTFYGANCSDDDRQRITDLYGTPPLGIYGSAELFHIAWQCPAADLYHVNHERVLVEVVNDDGRPVADGEPGHLALTGLSNPAQPMIRYRQGDSGAFATRACRCGHRLPALEWVQGRTLDWLVDDTGRRVSPQRLWLGRIEVEGVRLADIVGRYRLRQSADGVVAVEIEASSPLSATALDAVRTRYAGILGPGIAITVRQVDRIEVDGKFRQFSSDRTADRTWDPA